MWNRLLGLALFIIAIAVLIGFLKVLNWTPDLLQEGLPRTYASIEEVRSKLHIRDIIIPSYYPQGLQWPPARIIAQSKPYVMILMECTRQEDNNVSLIITQTLLPHTPPKTAIDILQMNERVTFPFKGRTALFEVGLCGNDEQCGRLSWNEPLYHVAVVMLAPPSEIMKIAESMINEKAQ